MKIFHSWIIVSDSCYEGDVERHFFIVRAHSEELAKKKLRKNEQYLSALNRAEREARRRGYDVEENIEFFEVAFEESDVERIY